jgi:hypothetical protein
MGSEAALGALPGCTCNAAHSPGVAAEAAGLAGAAAAPNMAPMEANEPRSDVRTQEATGAKTAQATAACT